ncbi:hypothetical protein V6N11_015992 [Hibiscus sabdariffa]|uniref:CW-type domain-containing protein n=1 Tax=Hibiscus sabdariffa TaxID=183260 RepID=A0ABR2TTP3_9ROSI
MEVVTRMVEDRPVVIFSRATCCMSHTIKTLISGFGANPTVYELDQLQEGQQVERALQRMGCKPSVPAVFIGQQLIGGPNQIMTLQSISLYTVFEAAQLVEEPCELQPRAIVGASPEQPRYLTFWRARPPQGGVVVPAAGHQGSTSHLAGGEVAQVKLQQQLSAAVYMALTTKEIAAKGNHDVAMEDLLEPILTQEIERENPRDGSSRKVLEEQKISVLDDISDYAGKDGYSKTDKTYDSVKAVSKTVKGGKALNSESLDPPKQRICQRDASHEQDNIPAKEHNSYGEKGKPKSSQGNGSLATEVPKENSRVGSSLMLKNTQTANVNNYTNKRESGNKKLERLFQKAEDWYGDSFGDIGESEQEENQTSSLEIRSEDWLKEAHKIEKTTSSVNSAHSDRLSGKKTEDLLATKSYPRTTVDGSSNSANVNVAGTSLAAAAPVLIIENWVHCDKCQKWRLLPININPADLPEKWLCSMLNWLPGMNHCNVAEVETTKAVFALYQVPAVGSLTNLQNGTTPLKKNIQPSVPSGSQARGHHG